jgi:hypothetical protein
VVRLRSEGQLAYRLLLVADQIDTAEAVPLPLAFLHSENQLIHLLIVSTVLTALISGIQLHVPDRYFLFLADDFDRVYPFLFIGVSAVFELIEPQRRAVFPLVEPDLVSELKLNISDPDHDFFHQQAHLSLLQHPLLAGFPLPWRYHYLLILPVHVLEGSHEAALTIVKGEYTVT